MDTSRAPGDHAIGWQFDNTYTRLPEILFSKADPAKVREPKVVILNHRLAHQLGLNLGSLPSEAAAALFAVRLATASWNSLKRACWSG